MSFLTGIPTECLFTNTSDGTALATFTAEASLLAGMSGAQPQIPAFFFFNEASLGKALKLRASGTVSSTGTPTFTFFVRMGTTIASVGGTSIGQSAAITTGSGISNQYWEIEVDLILRAFGQGSGNATLQAAGSIFSPGFASPFTYAMTPSASATAWTATFDTTATQYLNLSASCGTSNASNTVTLKQLTILGLN
ncbi:MAG: hypothetical protein ACRENL_10765 [Candidatus Dormibacteria bacterium]